MDDLILAFALIFVGALLMTAELVLYTSGVLAMAGLGTIIVGAIMVVGQDPMLGLVTLIALFIAVPLFGKLFIRYWPSTPWGKRLLIQAPGDATTIGDLPELRELDRLRGRYGKTMSPLRPSGITDFDGRRIDTLSEGDMIDAGQWVRCIDVRGSIVVVRSAAPPPSPPNLENIDLSV